MKNTFILALVMALVMPGFSMPASATSVRPITLEQLSTRAKIIFYGEAISNEVKKDSQSGRLATFTQFKILELIKGETKTFHTIKQIGGSDESSTIRRRIYGVPKFTVGKQYVVFLPGKSKLGFSSPLGLHQGSFSVTKSNGENIVSNGRDLSNQTPANNHSVQIPLAVDVNKPSQAQLDNFINTVRSFNAQ